MILSVWNKLIPSKVINFFVLWFKFGFVLMSSLWFKNSSSRWWWYLDKNGYVCHILNVCRCRNIYVCWCFGIQTLMYMVYISQLWDIKINNWKRARLTRIFNSDPQYIYMYGYFVIICIYIYIYIPYDHQRQKIP